MIDLEREAVASSRPAPRRTLASRINLGHLVMVVAGLFALVLNLVVLRSNEATVEIVVVANDVGAGTTLDSGHLSTMTVAADAVLTSRFVLAGEESTVVGGLLTRPVSSGQPVLTSDLLGAAGRDGRRAMSIPIDQTRAVSGQLARGDLIDVVLVIDGVASFVAIGVDVIDVPADATNALGARSGYAPTVAVDATQALRIAAALDSGEVHLVRSTGASPPDLTRLPAVDKEVPSE